MSGSTPFLFRWREAVASEHGPDSSTAVLVLIVLSLDADQDGGSCYPSTRRLASRTKLSRRSVEEHLRSAEDLGWIIRSPRGGGQSWKRMQYTLTVPDVGQELPHVRAEGGAGASPRPPLEAEKVGQELPHVEAEGGESDARRGEPPSGDVGNLLPLTSPKTSPVTSPPEGAARAAGSVSRREEIGRQGTERQTAPGGGSPAAGEGANGSVVGGGEPASGTTVERMATAELVGIWVDRQPDRPPAPSIRKQGAAGKRLVEAFTRAEILRALDGMGRLFPHAPPKSEPWDLFRLEKRFTEAFSAGAAPSDSAGGSRDLPGGGVRLASGKELTPAKAAAWRRMKANMAGMRKAAEGAA